MSQNILVSDPKKLQGFNLLCRSVKTTNEAEMNGEGVIPAKWNLFFREGALEHFPSRKNETILAVYTDYESDETGSYTFGIGTEIAPLDLVPAGMTSYSVADGSYVVFTTRKGPVFEIVVEAWAYIWEWSKTHKRAFLTDFEVYDERCMDPANSQVDIYISVLE